MSSFIKFALLLGAASLALASVIPCAHQISLEAVASGIVSPSGFWQISQKDTNLSINLFPFAPNGSAVFAVSQDAGATNKLDLIASFTGFPPGKGPYSIEFWYSRSGGYSFSGSNDNIEVFAIKGPLPVGRSHTSLHC